MIYGVAAHPGKLRTNFPTLYLLSNTTIYKMPRNASNKAYSEVNMQKAITKVTEQRSKSIRSATKANSVPKATLRNRLLGVLTRVCSYEHKQILLTEEEKTLFK